jgi:phosphotriesterase-related protein
MVNTVLGSVEAKSLGKTLIHEHFVFGYPGYSGDVTFGAYDKEEALRIGIETARKVQAYGVQTVVDPTPNECGRDPLLLKEISERTGLHIVCTTGYYYEGEGGTAYFRNRRSFADIESEIFEIMMTEITQGIGKTGVKAGAIKVASSEGAITEYEQYFFRAAAKAQRATGVPIITHTQQGTMGGDQARLLIEHGAEPSRIVIGHMDGNADVSYHLDTLQQGVYVALDRFGLQTPGFPKDTVRETVLLGLLGMGYADRLMLSHDTVNLFLGRPRIFTGELAELNQTYEITHLFRNVIPRLQARGVSEETLNTIFVDNPRRLFGG